LVDVDRGRRPHAVLIASVGFGSIAEYPGPFPGYTAAKPRSCAGVPRILGEQICHRWLWQVAPDPDNVQDAAGPFDHWPQSWVLPPVGFLSDAAGQYDPIVTQDNSTLGVPEARTARSTSRTTSPTMPSSDCTRSAPRIP
jgi:hypothetical protein